MKKHFLTKGNLRNSIMALAMVWAAIWSNMALAQQKVNDGTVPATAIHPGAIAEYQTNNKGILLPRVLLTSTTSFAPLGAAAAHVAGMTVYNTQTIGDVTPGTYYNDGTKWVRVANTASITTEPWNNVATGTGATANTQDIYQMGNVGIGTATPGAKLEVSGSLKFPTAGTPVAGKVLMTDNAGNATWQPPTGFGNTPVTTTGTFACPWNGAAAGIGFATGLSINIPSDGWYYFQTGITIQSACNDYWFYVATGTGNQDIFRVYCGAATPLTLEYMVPRDQNRLIFITAGTYPILAGKTNAIIPNSCNDGNPSVYVKAVKVQN